MGATQPQEQYAQKKTFFIVRDDVHEILIKNVSAQAERLYYLLRSYSDANHKSCWPKVSTLAERMRCSPDSITRYLKELEQVKVIRVERNRKTGRNTYHFILAADQFPVKKPKQSVLKACDSLKQSVDHTANLPKTMPQLCGYNNQIQILELDPNSTTTKPNPMQDVVVDSFSESNSIGETKSEKTPEEQSTQAQLENNISQGTKSKITEDIIVRYQSIINLIDDGLLRIIRLTILIHTSSN